FFALIPCCLSIRRATRCTLFPYTTLFRSEPVMVVEEILLVAPDQTETDVYVGEDDSYLQRVDALRVGCWVELHEEAGKKFRAKLDRKSTRLNSSHVKISYAVFCLKKKKKE